MSQGPVRVGFEKALANARRQKIIFARHEGTIAAALDGSGATAVVEE